MPAIKLVKKTLEYVACGVSSEETRKRASKMAKAMTKAGREKWVVGFIQPEEPNTRFGLVVNY